MAGKYSKMRSDLAIVLYLFTVSRVTLFFQVLDELNETLTFVDAENLKEKLVEVSENHTDRALEKLSDYPTGIYWGNAMLIINPENYIGVR